MAGYAKDWTMGKQNAPASQQKESTQKGEVAMDIARDNGTIQNECSDDHERILEVDEAPKNTTVAHSIATGGGKIVNKSKGGKDVVIVGKTDRIKVQVYVDKLKGGKYEERLPPATTIRDILITLKEKTKGEKYVIKRDGKELKNSYTLMQAAQDGSTLGWEAELKK